MKLLFSLPIEDQFRLDDDWPIRFHDDTVFRCKREFGFVTEFQVECTIEIGKIASIVKGKRTINIEKWTEVYIFFNNLRTYIQCIGEVEFDPTRLKMFFQPETPEEEAILPASGPLELVISGRPSKVPIFDFEKFAAALYQSRGGKSSHLRFIGEMKSMARRTFRQNRFLDSFRYNFLLLDSLYGRGQFRTKGLTEALSSSDEFVSALKQTRTKLRHSIGGTRSDTELLICSECGVESLIKHLVKKRGLYFHGNTNLTPERQMESDEGRTLAELVNQVTDIVCNRNVREIYQDEAMKELYEKSAIESNLVVTTNVEYTFDEVSGHSQVVRNTSMMSAGRSTNHRRCARWALRALSELVYEPDQLRLRRVVGEEDKSGRCLFQIEIGNVGGVELSEAQNDGYLWKFAASADFLYVEDSEDEEEVFALLAKNDEIVDGNTVAVGLAKLAIEHSVRSASEGIHLIHGRDVKDESTVFEVKIRPDFKDGE